MSAPPRTEKGTRTRAKILAVAAEVFAEVGYHDASIVKITERANVAQGTFYLYFPSKQEVFEEVVLDLNSRVRHAMLEASSQHEDRLAAERAGFRAFFRFTAENPALYRVIRQAEFVAPHMLRTHYERIAAGYAGGLRAAQDRGEVIDVDPKVAAWVLMGIGEIVGMRWALWEGAADGEVRPDGVPHDVFEATMRLVERALAPDRPPTPTPTQSGAEGRDT